MAKLHASIEKCKTEGEKKALTFFRDNLSDDYVIWGNVELLAPRGDGIQATEIDTILYHKDVGLLVFSIKDWRIDHIGSISADWIDLVNSKRFKNPYVHIKNQSYTLRTRLQEHNEFIDEYRRLQCAVNVAVIFPFIGQQEWENKLRGLNANSYNIKLPNNIILFKEMFEDSSLLKDKSRAVNKFQNMRSFKISTPFSEGQISYLDEVLGAPDTAESLVERINKEAFVAIDSNQQLLKLDEQQKGVADSYLKNMYKNPGHLAIKGVAGSGKTIILLHMFSQIARDPEQKILFVGRQRELVEDFRRNLNSLELYTEGPNYCLDTFHGFCRKIFGEDYLKLPKDKRDYPSDEGISQYIEANLDKFQEIYDFVFIDEGHNLPDAWIKLLVYSAKGRQNGNVVYVEDFEQNIYKIKRNFNAACIFPKNKIDLLINYRNTYEISYFALNLTDKYQLTLKETNRLSDLRHGSLPTVSLSENPGSGSRKIFDVYKSWIEEGFEPKDIVVIYPSADLDRTGLFMGIINIFAQNNILVSSHYSQRRLEKMFGAEYIGKIISRRDARNDKAVGLITTFSSQGLSYKCAIVIMDNFKIDRWGEDTQKNMCYISLTRATHNLSLIFSQETTYYKKAQSILKQMSDSQGKE